MASRKAQLLAELARIEAEEKAEAERKKREQELKKKQEEREFYTVRITSSHHMTSHTPVSPCMHLAHCVCSADAFFFSVSLSLSVSVCVCDCRRRHSNIGRRSTYARGST